MTVLITGGNFSARKNKAQEISPQALVFAGSGVEDIRNLERLVNTGVSVILESTQNLTVEAQNAFLKTLEEPPEKVDIILLAENEDQLLPTVVSRCFLINLATPNPSIPSNPSSPSDIFDNLKSITDRQEAVAKIDEILATKPLPWARQLLKAKKYLKANTNVRLTLENLFLS